MTATGTDPQVSVNGDGDRRAHTRAQSSAWFLVMAEHEPADAAYQHARGQLVELHLPLVEHLARRFRDRGEPLDDLVQVGTIGLIKSVDRFDPQRGVEFSTYATPTIIGEIKRHFRDKGWSVRVPRRLQEMRQHITVATEELNHRLGRSPTVAELAEHLGCSQEDILEGLESANAYSTISLDAGTDTDDTPSMLDVLGADDDALDGRRAPRVPPPTPGRTTPPRTHHPRSTLLPGHDPVPDRHPPRHLSDARLPTPRPHPHPAARRPARRGVTPV